MEYAIWGIILFFFTGSNGFKDIELSGKCSAIITIARSIEMDATAKKKLSCASAVIRRIVFRFKTNVWWNIN
jgi:hypothetical protein